MWIRWIRRIRVDHSREHQGIKRRMGMLPIPPFAKLDPSSVFEPEPEPSVDLGPDASSLDLLCAIYRDPTKPLSVRMRAAIAALPYEYPKLQVVANINTANFAAELEEAIARSGKAKVIDARRVATFDTQQPREAG
jgi:hypothetical protein